MEEKEFDQLTPEEKKARFQKALDDYNSGFVEVDYALRTVASIHVEEGKMPAEGWRNSSQHREECFLKLQKQT